MEDNKAMKSLIGALIKVQEEIGAIQKNKVNSYFKSHYADLQAVWDTVRPVLTKNGLAISQTTGFEGATFGLITTLLHESGESIKGFYILAPAKQNDPQSLAASLTYARRLALSAILSLVTDDDTDGNDTGASHHAPSEPEKPRQEAPRATGSKINDAQGRRLYAIAMTAGWTKESFKAAVADLGFPTSRDITVSRYEEVCKFFENAPSA